MAHLYFFSTHRPTLKKSKIATKPTHQDSSKQWTTQQQQTEGQPVTAPLWSGELVLSNWTHKYLSAIFWLD